MNWLWCCQEKWNEPALFWHMKDIVFTIARHKTPVFVTYRNLLYLFLYTAMCQNSQWPKTSAGENTSESSKVQSNSVFLHPFLRFQALLHEDGQLPIFPRGGGFLLKKAYVGLLIPFSLTPQPFPRTDKYADTSSLENELEQSKELFQQLTL